MPPTLNPLVADKLAPCNVIDTLILPALIQAVFALILPIDVIVPGVTKLPTLAVPLTFAPPLLIKAPTLAVPVTFALP